jgi:hypothetical protein
MEITAKKLPSGNIQVRFSHGGYYGYMLTEPLVSAEAIADKIVRHLEAMQNPDRYLQLNLYSMGSVNLQSGRIMIFREHAQAMAA